MEQLCTRSTWQVRIARTGQFLIRVGPGAGADDWQTACMATSVNPLSFVVLFVY